MATSVADQTEHTSHRAVRTLIKTSATIPVNAPDSLRKINPLGSIFAHTAHPRSH
jgi:hypothetical protein